MLDGRALAAALTAVVLASCVYDPHRDRRPARLQLGMQARRITVAAPEGPPGTIARSTTTPSSDSTTTAPAASASAQFTMTTQRGLYLGGEIETGTLRRPGSNLWGAYGVGGAEASSPSGVLAVEVATGWRAYRLDGSGGARSEDIGAFVVEPRVRAHVWLGAQLSLGASAGVNLDDGTWMTGAFLGVHSELFDTWRR